VSKSIERGFLFIGFIIQRRYFACYAPRKFFLMLSFVTGREYSPPIRDYCLMLLAPVVVYVNLADEGRLSHFR
jgi:hypothetical protein